MNARWAGYKLFQGGIMDKYNLNRFINKTDSVDHYLSY